MASKFDKRNEAVASWLAKSRFGPKLLKNASTSVIIVQWVLAGLYFPFAYISQWIPLAFIVFVTWYGGTFYAWREVIKATAGGTAVLGLGALLSTVATELLKFVFLFAALFDLFGTVVEGDRMIDGVWENVYFSIVTITTLGYGNLIPSGTISEVLAAIEAYLGFLFFAIVAGLSATIIVDQLRREAASIT